MRALYKKIAKDKKNFNLSDFEEVYYKKPHLLSWIDYFKNDDLEIYSMLDNSVIELLRLQFDFFKKFSKIMTTTLSLNGNKFNFSSANDALEKFIKIFESHKNKIENMKSNSNIRGIIEKLKKQNSNKVNSEQIQTPATVKNVKTKNLMFEEGIKIEDISLSFKNIGNLIKNTSLFNFEKFKKINSINQNISQFHDLEEKQIKIPNSDNIIGEEIELKEDSQTFPLEEPLEEGVDKESLVKLRRNMLKPYDDTFEHADYRDEEVMFENASQNFQIENNNKNNLRKVISTVHREDDIKLKKRTLNVYINSRANDFETENINSKMNNNLPYFNN